MTITGPQLGRISEALRDAFPYARFAQLLLYRLDRRIEDIAFGDDYAEVAFKVLVAARAERWVPDLVLAAVRSNPGNPRLAQVARELGLTSATGPDTALESIVHGQAAFQDISVWRSELARLEGRVCRVDVPADGGTAAGTGFLVGRDLVLTNHHVVRAAIPGSGGPRAAPESIRCLFDHRRQPDGTVVDPGTPFALASDWLVDSSPPSPADGQADAGALPTPDELDYALLRLAEPVGELPAGRSPEPSAPARGWIALAADTPVPPSGAPILILQHPSGQPMKLAFDGSCVGANGNGTRLLYTTNTLGGSSGSPCFASDWTLVALHHAGDPDLDRDGATERNEGIPIGALAGSLDRRGLLGLVTTRPEG